MFWLFQGECLTDRRYFYVHRKACIFLYVYTLSRRKRYLKSTCSYFSEECTGFLYGYICNWSALWLYKEKGRFWDVRNGLFVDIRWSVFDIVNKGCCLWRPAPSSSLEFSSREFLLCNGYVIGQETRKRIHEKHARFPFFVLAGRSTRYDAYFPYPGVKLPFTSFTV